jgi:inositol-hexakisphosphate 5-kinase
MSPPASSDTKPAPPAPSSSSEPYNAHSQSSLPHTQPSSNDSLLTKGLRQHSSSRGAAPLSALETLWTTGTAPQLSERESIFASTWDHSPTDSSTPSTARSSTVVDSEEHDAVSQLQTLPRGRLMDVASASTHLDSTAASSSVRLEADPKIRRLQDIRTNTAPTFSGDLVRQRGPVADLLSDEADDRAPTVPGMSPVSTPFERPSTPQSSLLGNGAISPIVDHEERLLYRSWRQGKPTLPRSKLKGDDPQAHRSQVDKTIEATLPKADMGIAAARSRKTSHYLGLFKGNDKAQDQRRQAQLDKEHHEHLAREGVDIKAKVSALSEAVGRGRLKDDATAKDASDFAENLESEAPRSVPADLLEQIRKHKNLTTRGRVESQRSKSARASPHEKSMGDYFEQPTGSSLHVAGTDEEDSEREQISSAVYFPHRQRTIDETEPDAEAKDESGSRRVPDVAPGHVSRRARKSETAQSPDEVQISLEDGQDTEYIHGNLPPSSSDVEWDESFIHSSDVSMTASETEYESHDDVGYASSVTGEELSTTPKAQRAGHPKRSHKKAPVPVGAVELKPYDHQVGGHSTVYRFSRRAVCKQLNNKENEFYEQVERNHLELLDFLPRYAFSLFNASALVLSLARQPLDPLRRIHFWQGCANVVSCV